MIWVNASLFLIQVVLTMFIARLAVRIRRLYVATERRLAAAKEHAALLEAFARALRSGAVMPFVIRPAEDDEDERGPLH